MKKFKLSQTLNKARDFVRVMAKPLALVIVFSLCIGIVPDLPAFASSGVIQVTFFHDLNADNRPDPSEIAIELGAGSIGFSGSQVNVAYSNEYMRNYGSSGIAEGVLKIDEPTLPQGYRSTGSYGIQRNENAEYTIYNWSVMPNLTITSGETTAMYVPLIKEEPCATLSGSVAFAEDNSAISGIEVELLSYLGNSLDPAKKSTTDIKGNYSINGISPASYQLRISTPQNDSSISYSSTSYTYPNFQILDAQSFNMETYLVHRLAKVEFLIDNSTVAAYNEIKYGDKIAAPIIDNSHIYFNNGTRNIVGWYRENTFVNPWNFENDTLKANTLLYAKYNFEENSTSSGNSSGSSGRNSDSPSAPKILSTNVSYEGNNILLSVKMDGGFPIFSYQWQILNSNDLWEDIAGATTAKYTYTKNNTGNSNSFRVIVTRETDKVTNTSGVIVTDALGISDDFIYTIPSEQTPLSAFPSLSGLLGAHPIIQLSNSDIFQGGRILAVANVEGGIWEWDKNILEGEDGSFFAKKPGTVKISYTVGGKSAQAIIRVKPALLPATGQSITTIIILICVGTLLITMSAFKLYQKRGRENNNVC